jgi:hypothetical protein
MWGVMEAEVFIQKIIYHPLLFIPKWMNIPSANKDGKKKKSKGLGLEV